ncbi:MAG: SIMPL domain-containing protein [Bacteroidota bacterium]
MKHLTIVIAFILCGPFYVMAQNGKNFIDQNYIEVTGTAEMLVIPDEIYVSIKLTEKNHKKTIEEQEQLLLTNLKSLGIDTDKNVSVANFQGNYERYFLKRNGVEKIKTYQLIVNDGATLAKVFLALDRLNITNASIEKVSHSELEKLRRDVKIKSLKVAKEKAVQYAQAIDQEIGKALLIEKQEPNLNYNANTITIRGQGSISNYRQRTILPEITNLTFQKINLTASILTRFELTTKNE